jgi:hypothetical protein
MSHNSTPHADARANALRRKDPRLSADVRLHG